MHLQVRRHAGLAGKQHLGVAPDVGEGVVERARPVRLVEVIADETALEGVADPARGVVVDAWVGHVVLPGRHRPVDVPVRGGGLRVVRDASTQRRLVQHVDVHVVATGRGAVGLRRSAGVVVDLAGQSVAPDHRRHRRVEQRGPHEVVRRLGVVVRVHRVLARGERVVAVGGARLPPVEGDGGDVGHVVEVGPIRANLRHELPGL